MSTSMKVVAPIVLGAALMAAAATTDASAAIRFDTGLTPAPRAEASIEKVWWHRHWHRHYGYHYRWHWHWHGRRW